MPLRWELPKGRVLVLAPHTDDETIGCGGALLLHRCRGDEVKVVFVTDGSVVRRREARRAADILNLSSLEFWNFPDGRLAEAKGLRRRIGELLKKERPDIVYRTSSEDPHPDHRALARRFEEAASGARPRFLDCRYEVCFLQKPSAVLDISAAFSRKAAALKQYRSQLRHYDYSAVITWAGICRSLFLPGADYAEAYQASRSRR